VASRISRGFGRFAIVVCIPIFLLGFYLAYNETVKPSGPLVVDLPEGVVAWEPSRPSKAERDIVDLMISEQTSAGIVAPPGYVILGVPLGVTTQDNLEWTKFQLRDGREIGIQSTDKKKITDTAVNFVWAEKIRGSSFTEKDKVEFGGVPAAYLNPFDQFPPAKNVWPGRRQRDWTWVWLTLCFGAFLYLAIRSIGWVVEGFTAA
jgi:hypothetical protein